MAKTDVFLQQQAVIMFLVAEGEESAHIHEHLLKLYGEATLDRSIV
jgi:hypothetical protein